MANAAETLAQLAEIPNLTVSTRAPLSRYTRFAHGLSVPHKVHRVTMHTAVVCDAFPARHPRRDFASEHDHRKALARGPGYPVQTAATIGVKPGELSTELARIHFFREVFGAY